VAVAEPRSPPGEDTLARHSVAVAKWTLVSRVVGFVRVLVVAAVLGPTYLGNTFGATNMIPNLVFELLAGSLIASLLVPLLVRHADAQDTLRAERVAGGFLGLAVAAFAAVLVAGALAGPLLLALLTTTVSDPAVAEAQRDAGLLLLALFAPQILFYAVAAVGGAVANADGRFALAAAAPALESVGVIATFGAFALVHGTGGSVTAVTDAELLLLGLGTTASVGLHAGAQWWGARRAGVRLRPRWGWRDPEVRELVRRTVPSLVYAALNTTRWIAATVVANAVAGGVVAFYLAVNIFFLPIAVGARPVATAALPALSRLHDDLGRFRDELVRAIALVGFVVVPAALACTVLARPLADALSFGEQAGGDGVVLLAACLAGLGIGMIGEAVFLVATNGAYAQGRVDLPVRGMAVRTVVSVAGMGAALAVDGGWQSLLALALAMTAGDVAAAWYLARGVLRDLPQGGRRLRPAAARAVGGAVLMILPAAGVAAGVDALVDGAPDAPVAMIAAAVAGTATFVALQRAWGSPELAFFAAGLGRRRG